MHSSGSITRMRAASWMQSTGQTSTQDLSLMSIQGSAMMYVTEPTLAKRSARTRQLRDEVAAPLDQRGLHDHLVEPVGVVRVAEDRHVGIRVGDLLGIDPCDVDDHEVRRIGVIDRDETMLGQERL